MDALNMAVEQRVLGAIAMVARELVGDDDAISYDRGMSIADDRLVEARSSTAGPSTAEPSVPWVIESIDASTDASDVRTSFCVRGSWCRSRLLVLRSGVQLGMTACQLAPGFSFAAVQPASEIELVVSKGGELTARTRDGNAIQRGGGSLQVGQIRRPLEVEVSAAGAQAMECVSVAMTASRLCELLGAPELPEAFRSVIRSGDRHPLVSQPMTPGLYRLLDEVLHADVRGPARRLWYEAKCLELVAMMTDEIVEAAHQAAGRLTAYDVERLERVRRCLIAHLVTPPSLSDLARTAGWSETKLKRGFRALFGTSIFAYLRDRRMAEAHRLLRARQLNVTEVASRVGYANPSKFAAAFRRQFGVSPSTI